MEAVILLVLVQAEMDQRERDGWLVKPVCLWNTHGRRRTLFLNGTNDVDGQKDPKKCEFRWAKVFRRSEHK